MTDTPKPENNPIPEPFKRGPGRPKGSGIRLTPELTKRIAADLEGGNYFKIACEANDVPERTGYEWLKRAEDDHPEGIYSLFAASVTRASVRAERNYARILEIASEGDEKYKGDWRAALEVLKRRFPDRWGDSQKLQINNVAMNELSGLVVQAIREGLETAITDPKLRARAIEECLGRIAAISGERRTDIART